MPLLVDLISVGSHTATALLIEQLGRLGRAVRVREPVAPPDHPRKPLLLFVPDERSRFTLPTLAAAPDLAIVAFKNGGCEPDLFDECSEVAGWPCDDLELRFRLERISKERSGPGAERAEDAGLLKEFAPFNLIGRSPSFLAVLRRMRQILGARDVPVLIEGETGTGKELVARALHYGGERRAHPFIPINCGAIPDTLIERELFGHERGAFTDAKTARSGFVEQAEGGTLFLDEVEALTPRAQVALLRFLQNQEYRPLGGRRLLRANVRVLAATNQGLSSLVEQGRFRDDLYFRLQVVHLRLPPLRERRDDVAVLAEHYAREFSSRYGVEPKPLGRALLLRLRRYAWPGNVRELENFVHCLVSVGEVSPRFGGNAAALELEGRDPHGLPPFRAAKARMIEEFETDYLCSVLEASNGNLTVAAQWAGKERRALGKLLKKYKIRRKGFAERSESVLKG